MPIRDRLLHEAAVRVALALAAADGPDRVTLTAVAERVRLPGAERVSERTLRRRYGSVVRLLFGTPWWMPEPGDAVRAVLEPRPDRTEGPVWPAGSAAEAAAAIVDDCHCTYGVPDLDERGRVRPGCCEGVRPDDQWPPPEFFTRAGIGDPLADLTYDSPEPIGLSALVHDLHVVITGHLIVTGWATRLAWVDELRAENPEVAAWLALSERAWAERLGPELVRLFGFDAAAGAVAARAFVALNAELEPLLGDLGTALLAAGAIRASDEPLRSAGSRVASGASRSPGARPHAQHPITRADEALRAARIAAADLFTTVLSEPDRIRVRRGRGTVVPGGPHAVLPHRAGPPVTASPGFRSRLRE